MLGAPFDIDLFDETFANLQAATQPRWYFRPLAHRLEGPAVCGALSIRDPSILYCECISISSCLCKIPATWHKY